MRYQRDDEWSRRRAVGRPPPVFAAAAAAATAATTPAAAGSPGETLRSVNQKAELCGRERNEVRQYTSSSKYEVLRLQDVGFSDVLAGERGDKTNHFAYFGCDYASLKEVVLIRRSVGQSRVIFERRTFLKVKNHQKTSKSMIQCVTMK